MLHMHKKELSIAWLTSHNEFWNTWGSVSWEGRRRRGSDSQWWNRLLLAGATQEKHPPTHFSFAEPFGSPVKFAPGWGRPFPPPPPPGNPLLSLMP